MTGTSTITGTKSFTLTEARYVTSKIAADLQSLKGYYNQPSDERITNFAEEAAILLAERCLESVEYGFQKNNVVIFSLKYEARSDGTLADDDRSGKIPAWLDLDGAVFYSYLRHNNTYSMLSDVKKLALDSSLPIKRTTGAEPTFSGGGYWEISHTYSRNGEGVKRQVFKQYG